MERDLLLDFCLCGTCLVQKSSGNVETRFGLATRLRWCRKVGDGEGLRLGVDFLSASLRERECGSCVAGVGWGIGN